MAGTGLYAAKLGPTIQADELYGAPVDNGDGTWTLTLLGGNYDATWEGGYVKNFTRGQVTRAIVEILSVDQVMVEGDCSTWQTGDLTPFYDAWATIQAALDQLWADQGAATFTASQYIRVYAGTYDENVVPNTGFVPDTTNGYLLVIEGDPADDRANIKIDPAAGDGVNFNGDQIRVRHMWINTVGAGDGVITGTSCYDTEVFDCKLTFVTGNINCAFGAHVEDCEITLSGDGRAIYSGFSGFTVKSCKITGPGKASSSFEAIHADTYFVRSPTIVEGCVISGFEYGVRIVPRGGNGIRLSNVDFHDCTVGVISDSALCSPREITNCIFKDCTYNYQVIAWPEETATQTGPDFIQRNNIYHGYTSFAYDGSNTKTYAQWIALGQVDDSGELDATDPLLTDPASGDFSLAAASPCRHAGHGSGVVADYLGTDFNAYHPDIGGWSSGAATTSPGITSVTATDSAVTVTVTAGSAPYVRAVLVDRSGAVIDEQGRLGAGVITLTPSAAGEHHVAAWSANAADEPVGEPTLYPRLVFVLSGAAATYSTIRSLLDQALNSYQASNVAWENTEYEPAVGTGWLRPTFLPAEPEQAELGAEGRNRLQGIYQVSVFAPTGKGSGEAEGRAEDLVAYFKRGKSFTSGDVTVRISRVWRGVAAQEADWFHVPVTIQWFAYVAN